VRGELKACEQKMADIKLEEAFYEGCDKRFELEQKIRETVNAARKEVQRQLDTLKNKQFGPKWIQAWANYNTLRTLKKEYQDLQDDLENLESHKDSIQPAVKFLYEIGYLKNGDAQTLKNEDLTLKGTLATEINEGHQILMTELYTRELLHGLSGEDIIAVLACFQETKETEDSPSIEELNVSSGARKAIEEICTMAQSYQGIEDQIGYPLQDYWQISTQMIEPMRRWIEGEHASTICQEHGLFEGNFIRSVMKMANMLDEWLALATYCQHTEQVDKIMEVRQKMIRGAAISDSLYLHL
jgi:antiviral helicase SKI2